MQTLKASAWLLRVLITLICSNLKGNQLSVNTDVHSQIACHSALPPPRYLEHHNDSHQTLFYNKANNNSGGNITAEGEILTQEETSDFLSNLYFK